MTDYRTKGSKLAIGLIVGLMAAGCSVNKSDLRIVNGPQDSYTAFQRHPIVVGETLTRMTIATPSSSFALSQIDRNRVQSFGRGYIGQGNGTINIMTPTGTSNAAAAIGVAAEVSNSLNQIGVDFRAIRVVPYESDGNDTAPPVIVSYAQYTAQVGPCGDFSESFSNRPRNTATPNFGCAYQSNVAAMVANPRDFIEPHGIEASDAQRRQVILEKYRRGEGTAAEARSEEEKAKGSDVAK